MMRTPLRRPVWLYRICLVIKGSSRSGTWNTILQNMEYKRGYSEIRLTTWLQRQSKRHVLEAGIIRCVRCFLLIAISRSVSLKWVQRKNFYFSFVDKNSISLQLMRFKKANHGFSTCVIRQLNSKIKKWKMDFQVSIFQ